MHFPPEQPAFEKYYDELWKDLPDYVRDAYQTLGYTGTMWDNEESAFSDQLDWGDLTQEQRDAAMQVGYTKELWEKDEDSVELNFAASSFGDSLSDEDMKLISKAVYGYKNPLQAACRKAAPLKFVRYFAESLPGHHKGDLLEADSDGKYPFHWACETGAPLEAIRFLLKEADAGGGKWGLLRADKRGMYPLHHSCERGASLEVIKYLAEETDGGRGKELLSKPDSSGS